MFKDFINQEYVKWRGSSTRRDGTITEFAEWLGVSQSAISLWMDGERTPRNRKTIRLLINRFGLKVIRAIYADKDDRQKLITLVDMLDEEEATVILPRMISEMRGDFEFLEIPSEDTDTASDEDR
jgi:predicted transcriptional regulator